RPIGHTTFQKIAYVSTEEGLPTGLVYQRGSYGPFSRELKKLETRLANNGLIVEERLGRMMRVRTRPTYIYEQLAYGKDLARWNPILERVADLFMRMDTQQAELTSTVLFAAHQLAETRTDEVSEKDVLYAAFEWKHRRKPPLEFEDVSYAI